MNIRSITTAMRKHRVATLSIAIAVVLGGLLLLRRGTLEELQGKMDLAAQENRRLATNVSNSSLLEEHLKAVQDANVLIGARLINPFDLAINQQYFYKIEAETGVKFLNLRQNSPVVNKGPKTTYIPVSFSISLRGSYTNALVFLRRLEQGPAFCRIIAASAGPESGDEKGATDVILNLTVELLGRP